MHVIGITGPINHGKSSLAGALRTQVSGYRHLESSDIIAEVVNAWKPHYLPTDLPVSKVIIANAWISALPPILSQLLNWDVAYDTLRIDADEAAAQKADFEKLWLYIEQLTRYPALKQEVINAATKERHRPILQFLGGYLFRFNQSVWLGEIVRRIRSHPEVELVTVSGLRFPEDADVLKQVDALIVQIERPDLTVIDAQDPTERERGRIVPDVVVLNNGSLADLDRAARKLWEDIRNGSLQPQYKAHTGFFRS